jgi:hypothetical protein
LCSRFVSFFFLFWLNSVWACVFARASGAIDTLFYTQLSAC